MTKQEHPADLSAEVQRYLGQYRAEYLQEKVFELFLKPAYWDRLSDSRPCLIVGGRGTGKTTTLKQLAYEGQYRSHGLDMKAWKTLGLYWRVETNVTSAFQGARLSDEDWVRIFSHFVNLHFVELLVTFVDWRRKTTGIETRLDPNYLRQTCIALSIKETTDFDIFSKLINDELLHFEASINGFYDSSVKMNSSMLGRPVSKMVAAVLADETLDASAITFCIDEYENLFPYQQKVLNTLIKHVGDAGYTFKIGMRQNGLHERSTLSPSEYLVEPADFVRINIEDEIKKSGFNHFAALVCNERLAKIAAATDTKPILIDALLPSLSSNSEALLLGADRIRSGVRDRLAEENAPPHLMQAFDSMNAYEVSFVEYWSKSQGMSESEVLLESVSKPSEWKTRIGNHGYAMLFSIRSGRRGISKYYSGLSTFVLLADGNIRFLLYLVTEALLRHINDGGVLSSPVSAENQTLAAEAVGERIVLELAGLDRRGTQLTRLVLGLGRVFGVMARQPFGHAPEISQFRIDDQNENAEVIELLQAGVMHNALVGFTGDKMAGNSAETKALDYQMHPIFAPFFVYSPRRKRRMILASNEFLGLASTESSKYIRALLKKTSRNVDVEIPTQLSLFSEYFDGK